MGRAPKKDKEKKVTKNSTKSVGEKKVPKRQKHLSPALVNEKESQPLPSHSFVKDMEDNSGKGKSNKLAPRSSMQFKVGPAFMHTSICIPLIITSTNETITPFISARIDRGFDNVDETWVGYKRNYFTLVSSFQFKGKDATIVEKERFHIVDKNGVPRNIKSFHLRLVARCYEDGSTVTLVQHTAKRDRGPQRLPPVFPAVPSSLPSHNVIRQVANIRNNLKINQYNKLFFADESLYDYCLDNSILQTYSRESDIYKVAKYERIQFSGSGENKRATMAGKHCILQVQLLGLLLPDEYLVLAFTDTPALVVRGRSPSSYLITRRALLSKSCELKSNLDRVMNIEEEGHTDSKLSEAETTKDKRLDKESEKSEKAKLKAVDKGLDKKHEKQLKRKSKESRSKIKLDLDDFNYLKRLAAAGAHDDSQIGDIGLENIDFVDEIDVDVEDDFDARFSKAYTELSEIVDASDGFHTDAINSFMFNNSFFGFLDLHRSDKNDCPRVKQEPLDTINPILSTKEKKSKTKHKSRSSKSKSKSKSKSSSKLRSKSILHSKSRSKSKTSFQPDMKNFEDLLDKENLSYGLLPPTTSKNNLDADDSFLNFKSEMNSLISNMVSNPFE